MSQLLTSLNIFFIFIIKECNISLQIGLFVKNLLNYKALFSTGHNVRAAVIVSFQYFHYFGAASDGR